jgi:hypothetical protein
VVVLISGIHPGGTKGERRSVPHKRLLYCVKVNRTSLDHLLLGKNADVDKNVECYEYSAASARCQNKRFTQAFGETKVPGLWRRSTTPCRSSEARAWRAFIRLT